MTQHITHKQAQEIYHSVTRAGKGFATTQELTNAAIQHYIDQRAQELPAQTKQVLEKFDGLQSAQPVAPHAWAIQGSYIMYRGEHAEMDAKAEAKRCGGTCYAYPLYCLPPVEPNIQKYPGKDISMTGDEYTTLITNGAKSWDGVDAQELRNGEKTCETCAHFEQGKLPGVRVHDETCYGCKQYYGSQWEAKNE